MQLTFKKIPWLTVLTFLGLSLPWLAGCGSDPLSLGQPGQPTLVFIYTDG
jgi:hypothetical protein